MTSSSPAEAVAARDALQRLRAEVAKAVIGQDAVVGGVVIALLCSGHVLLEGVPGVAKTLLVRALAAALDVDTKRVQFTPDLMPGDVTGSLVYDARPAAFNFRPGPIFTNLLLGDEINRTPPKTQAALLEAMEERTVSTDGETRRLPEPFIVVATQNPIEYEGTYPLPEAQLDRFLMRVTVGYPDTRSEVSVAAGTAGAPSIETLPAIAAAHHIGEFIQVVRQRVSAADAVVEYAVRIAQATRSSPYTRLGAGPRGSVALVRAAKVRAASQERAHLLPEDIKALAGPVLTHRLLLSPDAELAGWTGESVLAEILANVPAPTLGGLAKARS